ncbi:MAG: transketolase-like TK C-terminal-containing protein, partial [Pyrinomonadaceae bacterium]
LQWPEDKEFYIPEKALSHFRAAVERGAQHEAEWDQLVARYAEAHAEQGRAWQTLMKGDLPEGWEAKLPSFEGAKPMATRAASGEVLNALAPHLPMLVGGSADLGPSNNTDIKDGGSFQSGSYDGRILHFGVREHAMGSTLTGISLNGGLIPYGGTFLCFSDYMKASIRLAALSEVQVIYIFTHDSVGLGEDGPTHQPIEHLAALRAIPHLYTIRPADAHETREAWRIAIERRHAPTALILTRQKVPTLDRKIYAPAAGAQRGAYILAEATDKEGNMAAPQLILLATGSEVSLALEAREALQQQDTPTRVVSMPCWELFEEQDQTYRDEVLPPAITARLSVEAGARLGWDRYVGWSGDSICLERFGASAPGDVALRELGFNVENVVERARALLNGR